MAIIAPSRPVETRQRISDGKSLAEALHPWRRRLWMQQVVRWTGRGLFVGLVLACLVLLISRFVPWASASYWAGGLATASLLCALAAALWYRPSFARTARRVDALRGEREAQPAQRKWGQRGVQTNHAGIPGRGVAAETRSPALSASQNPFWRRRAKSGGPVARLPTRCARAQKSKR